MIYNDNLQIAAQSSDDGINATSSFQPSQVRLNLDNNDDFKIEGIITPDTDDLTAQRSSIYKTLDGTWLLVVVNGNVEYFKTNLTMVRPIGTDLHDHLIEFKSDDPDVLLLPNNTALISPNLATPEIAALNLSTVQESDKNVTSLSQTDGTVAFSGTADIQTNGVIEWRGIPTSVSLLNASIININITPEIVNDHFSEKPINGSVTSIEPIIITIQNRTG